MKINKLFKSEFLFQLILSLVVMFAPLITLAQNVSVAPAAQKSCDDFKDKFNVTINGQTTTILAGQPFYCTASELIVTIINYLLVISGSISILFIMIGGFWYLTSAGNDELAEKGKKTLINAVIGLVVITLAFTIVRIVNSTLSLGK